MKNNWKKIPYLEILKKSFALTFKNRYLWWFGFLATLGAIGKFNYAFDEKSSAEASRNFLEFYQNHAGLFFPLVIALVILVIAVVFLQITSRGALIDSIEKHNKGEKADFKSGWKNGRRYFWKIFFLDLFLGLLMLGVIAAVASPIIFLFLFRNYLIGIFMSVLATLIIIPLAILASYLKTYGYLYIVLGKLNVWPALENAYAIFRKNIYSSFLMGLIFIPINFLIFISVFFAILPIAIIFFGAGAVLFLVAGKIGAIIIAALGATILGICFLLIRSILEVFSQTAWILFFHEIATPALEEIIVELEKETNILPKAAPVIELTEKKN